MQFLTTDLADNGALGKYTGLDSVPIRMTAPSPFTYGDYRKWYQAALAEAKGVEVDSEDFDDTMLMAQYRAAHAVCDFELVGEESEDSHYSFLHIDPDNDNLPLDFASWACECFDEVIAPLTLLETAVVRMARWAESPTLVEKFDVEDFVDVIPGLKGFTGTVTFPRTITKKTYSSWKKAFKNKKRSAYHIDASLLVRTWKASVAITDKWDIDGISSGQVKKDGGAAIPLALVSWMSLISDEYMYRRLNLKKLQKRSGSSRFAPEVVLAQGR